MSLHVDVLCVSRGAYFYPVCLSCIWFFSSKGRREDTDVAVSLSLGLAVVIIVVPFAGLVALAIAAAA